MLQFFIAYQQRHESNIPPKWLLFIKESIHSLQKYWNGSVSPVVFAIHLTKDIDVQNFSFYLILYIYILICQQENVACFV